MKTVLVTGGSGLLGSNLTLALRNDFDVCATFYDFRLDIDRVQCEHLDLRDAREVSSLVDRVQPDWIAHCAAIADVDYCETRPDEAMRTNVTGTSHIASSAARIGARFLYVSSDSVFDGERGYYNEEDDPNPVNVYSKTKLAGEQIVTRLVREALIVRTNFYGWSLRGHRSLAEWMFDRLQERTVVKGFRDVYFSPILVNNLVDVLVRMIKQGASGTFHVVGSERCSKYAFGRSLAQEFELDERLVQNASVSDVPLVAPRPRDTSLCIDKVRRVLALELPDMTEGLKQFKELQKTSYLNNLRGFEK